jgi:CheY-like chemotaxis protein
MVQLNPAPLRRPCKARTRPPSASAAASSELDLEGVRVAIVEDDPDSRELLVAIFAAAGADVSSAASAGEGFELVSVTAPQLLVSDIAMPYEDGYSLMRRVRAAESAGSAALPAIALTAFGGDEARRRALRAGFSLHMCKPVDAPAILAAAKRLTRALSS